MPAEGAETSGPDEGRVHYDRLDRVGSILLDRPRRRHALTSRMIIELAQGLAAAEADPDVRSVVISSTGTETFTVGGDLGELLPLFTGVRSPASEWDEALLSDVAVMGRAMMVDSYPKPVVAAVAGDAIGGGFEIMLACDLRIVSSEARYGLPEVRRGVVPGAGSMVRLPRQVPWAAAMEILLLGDLVTAEQLLSWGLVNRVERPDRVFHVALAMAHALADNAPLAVQGCKEVALRTADQEWSAAFAIEREVSARVMMSLDAREGPRAFKEKRAPRFEGR
jgi:enoyl-CoA hydratase